MTCSPAFSVVGLSDRLFWRKSLLLFYIAFLQITLQSIDHLLRWFYPLAVIQLVSYTNSLSFTRRSANWCTIDVELFDAFLLHMVHTCRVAVILRQRVEPPEY